MDPTQPAPLPVAVYLRVSKQGLHLDNQWADIKALVDARGLQVARVFEEQESAARHRPVLDELLREARRGRYRAIVVWALDRLHRSMVGAVNLVLECDRIGVPIISTREPWMDTTGPVRPLLVAVFGWVAEQERSRLITRTLAGLARARREGKRLGRPPARIDVQRALALRSQGIGLRAAARQLGVGASTLGRVLHAHDQLQARCPDDGSRTDPSNAP